jgi:cytochrome P450
MMKATNVQVPQKGRNQLQEVPGPRGNFILGSSRAFQRDPLSFITHIAQEYGPVARYRLGNVTFHQVVHPDGVQRILQEHNHNYVRGKLFDILRDVGGDGLITSEGSHWLRQRRLMQPAFHRQRIGGFGEIMTGQTLEMLGRWAAEPGRGRPLDINQEMSDLTMAIISETMFGTRVEADVASIRKAIAHLLEYLNFRFEYPFYPGMRTPTLRNRQARRQLQILDNLIYSIIEKRRRSDDRPDDLLTILLNAQDEETGEVMSDQQLRDEVITIFVAGHETTAATLAWTFYLLSLNPQAESRLHAELDTELAGRTPTMADLPVLKYTRMVIDESMRLYPPAWITSRTCVVEDEILGYRIPAGEIVAVTPYVTHRLQEYWPEAERFDPERFNPDAPVERPRYAYFPFSGGPHQCIGNNFALVEATLVLATIAQRYRLNLAPGQTVRPSAQVTMRPRGGLTMEVIGRGSGKSGESRSSRHLGVAESGVL